MKTIEQFITVFALGIMLSSCIKNEDEVLDFIPAVQDRQTITVEGKITANTTWEVKNKYLLKGFVYVEAGATLTIQPGTIIKGDKGTKATLIVKPGAKIIADGTVDKPIIFTSNQPKGQRDYGDWGGLVILGNANVNKPDFVIEGENVTKFGTFNDATKNTESSGTLRYVRVEFAGIAFEPDKEINGLTFGGVGSGTIIDYVQVSYSGDDSYEWFGGAVNTKHLIAFRGLDDDFDTDNGFSGRNQFMLSLRDPKIADQCSCSSSNGFESDNDGSGSNAVPQTSAIFSNVTIVLGEGTPDKKYNNGILIRRNSAQSIYNTVIVGGYPRAGFELNGTASQDNFKNGKADYQALTLNGMTTKLLTVDVARFSDATRKNSLDLTADALKLSTGYNSLAIPRLIPQTNSPVLVGAAKMTDSFFETVDYKGAFGTTDWTAKWANFEPQSADY
jgi:hypothetical protein